jgi:hypothetical protein
MVYIESCPLQLSGGISTYGIRMKTALAERKFALKKETLIDIKCSVTAEPLCRTVNI